jgi:uncharacterized lipoprotein YmbA
MIRIFSHGVVALALCLAACASAPIEYLTLVPPAGAASVADPKGAPAPVVSVTVPAQVDQPELVVRQGDDSMGLLESERWIGPLRDEIRASLTLALAQRWDTIPAGGADARTAAARLAVDVQRFDSLPHRYALLEAAWTLTLPASGPALKAACRSVIRIPVGGDYRALAAGHQQALAVLADQVAAQARALRAGKTGCEDAAATAAPHP